MFEDSGFTQTLNEISSRAHYRDLYAAAVQENPKIGIYGVDAAPFLGTMGSLVFESLILWTLLNSARLKSACKTEEGIAKEKEKISRREMLKRSAIIGGTATLGATYLGSAINSLMKKEVPGVSELNSIKTTIFPTPIFAFRDAVTAKKISEYLVPKHKGKGRKVHAAIAAGALHSDIESKLKHPWIADKTIEFYHQFLGYAEREEMNEVRQLKIVNGNRLAVVIEDCGIF